MFANLPPELIWFFLGFILLLGELAIPAFIVIFFGVGAWVTAISVFIGVASHINIQLTIFLITSILTLVLFRKKIQCSKKRKFHEKNDGSNRIGQHGVVVEDIKPHLSSGRIELNGTHWQAMSDVLITKGTEVEVVDQINLTLKVKPIL